MNEDIKLDKNGMQSVDLQTQMSIELKSIYKKTFAEIHASEVLDRKVRNMTKMNRKKESSFAKRFVTVAATMAVLFVGSNGVIYAATGSTWIGGVFRDVTDWSGAVIGAEYVQATNEVGMSVSETVRDKEYVSLPVVIDFYKKDEAPFRYMEEVRLENYKVLDEAGKEVVNSKDANATGIVQDGVTEVVLWVDGAQLIQDMEYTLIVESFYGQSKADAPLAVKGNWECRFVVEDK